MSKDYINMAPNGAFSDEGISLKEALRQVMATYQTEAYQGIERAEGSDEACWDGGQWHRRALHEQLFAHLPPAVRETGWNILESLKPKYNLSNEEVDEPRLSALEAIRKKVENSKVILKAKADLTLEQQVTAILTSRIKTLTQVTLDGKRRRPANRLFRTCALSDKEWLNYCLLRLPDYERPRRIRAVRRVLQVVSPREREVLLALMAPKSSVSSVCKAFGFPKQSFYRHLRPKVKRLYLKFWEED